jgi:hypothetical protein
MSTSRIAELLEGDRDYSVEPVEGGAIVSLSESDSSYVVAELGGSLQIRQIVVDGEAGYASDVLLRVLYLIAKINDRFTCCKFSLDIEGNIVNCCDIASESISTAIVKDMLNQVEFVSTATDKLFVKAIDGEELVHEAEIDEAFTLKRLQ